MKFKYTKVYPKKSGKQIKATMNDINDACHDYICGSSKHNLRHDDLGDWYAIDIEEEL